MRGPRNKFLNGFFFVHTNNYVQLISVSICLDAGGICEKMRSSSDGRKILNTGVVTFINYGKSVPQRVSEITFAHEVGHNFGSPVSVPAGYVAPYFRKFL
jgi:hypothetical protein